MHKILYTLLATILLFACGKAPEPKPTTPLTVTTSTNGDVRFNVEVAQTPEELQNGLMHRTEMPSNNGMIFVFDPIRPVQMWMKNTKLPLDMLFVAGNGQIIMIKEKATPMSENRITCKDPVRAVIELNAGQVNRHKIQVGDFVKHKTFDKLTALSDTPIPAKGPKALTKGPNSASDGPVIPKGPKAIGNADGPVIPKGPKAIDNQAESPAIVPVAPPM